MNPIRHVFPVALLALLAVAACSSDETKKKPVQDGSTADGSSGSGGTGGSAGGGGSAGVDAAAGSGGTAGASGSAGSDAGLDATADADAATGCATGTVRELQSGACLACPADGGTAGGAGADGGADPFAATLTCQELASSATSFDPSTGLLVIHLDYALQVDSLDYALSLQATDADGGYIQANPTGTVPVVNNTATVDLGAALGSGATLSSLSLDSVAYTDACGRVSAFDNKACDVDYLQLDQGDGGLWTASCWPC